MSRIHAAIGGGVAIMLAVAVFSSAAFAGANDYAFEVVQPQVKESKDAIIAVRLLHKPTGKPVADAVIFQTRLDMSPEGMGDMVSKVAPLKSDEPGVYRFKADMSMAGGYALNLAAKVPGETETVRAKLVIKATK